MTYYSYREQAAHYRQGARDRGCTCPDLMAPHTHLLECPLYEVPGGTPRTFHAHPGRHDDPPSHRGPYAVAHTHESSPADDVRKPSPYGPDGASPPLSPPRDGPGGAGETEPEGAGKDSPPSGAGAFDAFIKRAVEDSVNAYEREEDHAEERHLEKQREDWDNEWP